MRCTRAQAVLAASGLSFAHLELFVMWMLGHREQCQEELGTAGWRRVHWRSGSRKALVQDAKSWFGGGERVQMAGLESV